MSLHRFGVVGFAFYVLNCQDLLVHWMWNWPNSHKLGPKLIKVEYGSLFRDCKWWWWCFRVDTDSIDGILLYSINGCGIDPILLDSLIVVSNPYQTQFSEMNEELLQTQNSKGYLCWYGKHISCTQMPLSVLNSNS